MALWPTVESHIPKGGNHGPITAYMVISQSYWSLHVRQHTAESGSESRSFFWERLPGRDVDRLNFLFQNDPRPEHRSRSPRHLGSCSLDTAKLIPSLIQGVYFTDRYTQGEMKMGFIDRSKGYGSFDEAAAPVTALRAQGAPI